MDAGSPTLLERLIGKQRQNPRRSQQSPGDGMRTTVSPMDSTTAQAMMDTAQQTTVSQRPSSPIRLASDSEESDGGSPFRTAELRRSGGSPTPVQTAQCPGGRCGIPSGMANQSQYPIVTNERVIAINGKPVDPSQPVPGGSPAAPAAPTTAGAMYSNSRSLIDQANAAWPGNPAMAANLSILGRNEHKAALENAAHEQEMALLREQFENQKLNDEEERENQRVNRKAQKAASTEGGSEAITHAVEGIGDFEGDDPESRAAAATAKHLAMTYPDGKRDDEAIVKQTYDKYHSMATAHDLSRLIAMQASRGEDGKPLYSHGNRDAIDQRVKNRFFGRTVGDVNGVPKDKQEGADRQPLTGEALRTQMHKELDGPVSKQLAYRFRKISPGMTDEDAINLGISEAHKVVEDHYNSTNIWNHDLSRGDPASTIAKMQAFYRWL